MKKAEKSTKNKSAIAAQWEEIYTLHAAFCRIFSDPKRLRIMWLLEEREESTVGEISAYLGASMQNTSQHLRIMRDNRALHQRREGQTIYYSIANKKFLQGANLIRAGVLEEFNIEPPISPDPGAGVRKIDGGSFQTRSRK